MTCIAACAVASAAPPAMTTDVFPLPCAKPAVLTNWASPLIKPTAAAAPNVDR